MGSVASKKRKLKIKNVIPKDKDMQRASGKMLLRKDPDIDVFCFDLSIDGFHSAPVRLSPQNHPMNPPTPNLSLAVSSSGSGYDLH